MKQESNLTLEEKNINQNNWRKTIGTEKYNSQLSKQGGTKIKMNIKSFAEEYVPQQMKNITDLEVVPITLDIISEERVNNEGDKYKVIFVKVDGEDYRIPGSVIEQIKGLIAEKPDMISVKVTKTGSGLGTKYQTIPL